MGASPVLTVATSPGSASHRLPARPTESFPYQLHAKVGEGAMGEVYRAEDHDLHRQVAIKVVKLGRVPPDETSATVQRFLQEARAAAAITHPNVPIIYRVGLESGWPYIVMEWIEGTTLEALLARGERFSVAQASRIAIEVLSALEAAHAAGVVHRDIKPGNLMITSEGRVKVTDFGIARMSGDSALAHTQAGAILGTPYYAAPEQLTGQNADRRADLYGVGCVLFEAVTGSPPYQSPSLHELVTAILAADPPAPGDLVPDVPPGFDVVVQRALALDPDDRFAGAREMAAALAQVVALPTLQVTVPVPARRARMRVVECTPTALVGGSTPLALVLNTVRSWPANAHGRRPTRRFLERVTDRPIHAAAFAGAVSLDERWLLVNDGLIYAAFDPVRGHTGDALVESLPDEADATLYPVPDELSPEVISVLASLLHPARTRIADLDSSFTNLHGLVERLQREGFDGALKLVYQDALGYALFRKGRRVLDLFGDGWPAREDDVAWEEWAESVGVRASVDEMAIALPSLTFRQQLRGAVLEVVRPARTGSGSIRYDAVAEARAIELRPCPESRTALRRGESTYQMMVDADPAGELARWLVTELGLKMTHYGRAARWRALVAPLDEVGSVRLHHAVLDAAAFDVVTFDEKRRARHVADRVALGTEAVVSAFFDKAIAAKAIEAEIGGAILVAPRFDDAGLAVYLARLAGARSWIGLDGLRHREGYLRVAGGGLHVLLVEESPDGRRPLVPE